MKGPNDRERMVEDKGRRAERRGGLTATITASRMRAAAATGFPHGLYEEKAQPKWYLHGLFA
jgi:hypothetical protein